MYYSKLENRERIRGIPRTQRYRVIRRFEVVIARLLHMISGSWDYRKGYHAGHAFCDGLLIGSAPWLCYCCVRLRLRLQGKPFVEAPRNWIYGEPLRVRFFKIHTWHRGVWVWPCVKWVYEGSRFWDGGVERS